MTGGEFRTYVGNCGWTVERFTRQVADVYVQEHGTDVVAARRNVKRWFSAQQAERDFTPKANWRAAIREVLGEDPFATPIPYLEILARLESLEDQVVRSGSSATTLLAALAEQVGELRRELALPSAAATQGQLE